MLILGFLFCISFAQTIDQTFEFKPADASGNGADWTWELTRNVVFAKAGDAGSEQKFKLDFADMLSTKSDGTTPVIGDHYMMTATYRKPDTDGGSGWYLDGAFKVTGSLGACVDKSECYSDIWEEEDCDFSRGDTILTAKNMADFEQTVAVKFLIEGNDETCSSLDDIKGWFEDFGRLILIITIVSLVLCICCIALICCGVVKCCCMQQQPNQVVVETAKY